MTSAIDAFAFVAVRPRRLISDTLVSWLEKQGRMAMETVFVTNYTPHTVTLLTPDGSVGFRFESRGVARCAEQVERLKPLAWDPFGDCGMSDLLPIVAKSFGEVTGLPECRDGCMFIVSQIVADACPKRSDLLVPSDVVRDGAGQVLGCRSFSWRDARSC